MKNILIATDFSDNAKCAFDFAVKLAKEQKVALHVFHSYQLQTYYEEIPMNMAGDMTEQFKDEAIDNMKELVKNVPDTLKLKTYIGDNIFTEELNGYVEKENIDLIIIGAGGGSKLKYAFLGSMANLVIEKIKCPVLIIPPGYKFKNFSKIVYASDLTGDESTVLVKFVEFAKLFNADFTILHIKNKGSESEENGITKLLASVRLQTNYPKVHIEDKYYPDTVEGINDYLGKTNPDLFTMAIHERSLLEKIFHASLTKKMAHISQIPLLTCHKHKILNKGGFVNTI